MTQGSGTRGALRTFRGRGCMSAPNYIMVQYCIVTDIQLFFMRIALPAGWFLKDEAVLTATFCLQGLLNVYLWSSRS